MSTGGFRPIGELLAEQRARERAPVARATENPFKGAGNATRISVLIKRDPTRARRLCEEAGQDWRTYQPYTDNVAGFTERRREEQQRIERNFR